MAEHLADAVDKVRRAEHRELLAQGSAVLARTRCRWLTGRGKTIRAERLAFAALRENVDRTARAWAVDREPPGSAKSLRPSPGPLPCLLRRPELP